MAEETMNDFKDEIDRSFRKVKEGDILEGTVIDVSDTEVTLDLKYYTQGIIKVEDLSNDPKFNIHRDIAVGDEISATVVSTDDGRGNILLSKKEATQVLAWDKLKEYLESGEYVDVKVSEAVKAGAVAFLEGIRGFIPASKLDLNYVEEDQIPEFVGKTLKVKVITVNPEDNKLVLSAREYLKEQADAKRAEMVSNVEVGLVTEGVVESLQNYGAFINLGNGLSGLVHISQICNQRIAHPSAVLKVGQKVKVKVTAIKDGKLSLSMKALEEIAATEITEEKIEFESEGEATTSLADLLKKAGF
ncbi:MAG: S1 RNA-binding domain-containing protein [Butyrivibrio sp.]|jgi:small subunit ribosomal protein S1|uniref:S1 RNA-binding domain-containing protein n=1 Tax=Butyrivibrio sp. TaxID=28121 RepID=UPI001B573F5D|nr:S1 RNA-binding domain-containing protein [Butyrivibrio sp.]MBE5824890.1 S1 RNA-binding domain-containing protein [Butyrivibrio sp.]MBP3278967.1 S1 RNA-binding domain-containing protein [Butyrivibrio sp.]MBP3783093.1 S1 RNA-binding domain-containing protein [Butyrivibrio sp.]MBP3825697.1 S1 RNA-binding domain-containing protein [Butyrivibrio sp.]